MKHIPFHIKEPCSENWSEMTPTEQGRFCDSCSKCVQDLSHLNTEEIVDLLEKSDENICARLKSSQLHPGTKDSSVTFSSLSKAASIAVATATLLSCNSNEEPEPIAIMGGLRMDDNTDIYKGTPTIIKGLLKNLEGEPLKECAIAFNSSEGLDVSRAKSAMIQNLKS